MLKQNKLKLTVLDRYLLKEFTGPFVLAVMGFAVIAIVDILMYLVELTVLSGISVSTILRLLLYKLPAVMILFFPMAVLFAVMLMLIRMAKDNEITILRTSGINTFRIVGPILLMALLSTLASYWINEELVPWTNKISNDLIRREVNKRPPPIIAEKVIFKDEKDRFFYIEKINRDKSEMHNIIIIEPNNGLPRITLSKNAQWSPDAWILSEGHAFKFDSNGDIEFSSAFSKTVLSINKDIHSFYKQAKTPKEMSSKELKDAIQQQEQRGQESTYEKVELAVKKSIPVTCLIFGIIGIAFCLSFVKSGKDWWGVIIAICTSVLLVGFYFFIMAFFKALAKGGSISPFLGAWTPNLIYGILGTLIIAYQCRYK